MRREYCSKCKAIKNLRASITTIPAKDEKGKAKETTITAYHCEECNSFIKSEESGWRTTIYNYTSCRADEVGPSC